MQVAVRSYLTAGMTLVGAGAIALSPIAPSLPATVHVPTIHEAAVDLAAAAGPLETWVQVLTQAFDNSSDLGQQVIADPAPILAQIITNQLANAAVLNHATKETVDGLVAFGQGLAANLPVALGQIADGNITGAEATLLNPLLGQLLTVLQGPIDAYAVVSNTFQNVANIASAVTGLVLTEGLAITGPVWSTANALTDTAQAVVDEGAAGDLGAVVNTMLTAPAVVTGAFLNGYGNGPLGFAAAGLLTPSDNPLGSLGAGPIAALLDFRDTLAAALKPLPAPPTANALKAIEAKSTIGTTTLALSTGPAAAAPADEAPAATTGTPIKAAAVKVGAAKADDVKAGAAKADDGTAVAAPATDSTVKGKHRAPSSNPVKKLGDNIKKSLGGAGHKAEKAKASASK
ncbi:MAG: hypothetical protein ABWY93_13010 [Mycobacterium sp.]